MRNILKYVIIAFLVSTCVILSSCSCGDNPDTETDTQSGTITDTQTETDTQSGTITDTQTDTDTDTGDTDTDTTTDTQSETVEDGENKNSVLGPGWTPGYK